MKPDLVMEGGNMSADSTGTVLNGPDSLRLITTEDRFRQRGLLAPMGDTSASAALASRMAAQIIESYPDLWPETVRGLMIHSADWTPQMLREAAEEDTPHVNPMHLNLEQKEQLMRKYGYGVPNLGVALHNARNSLTLISEDHIQPFDRSSSGNVTSKDLNLHNLPWPKGVLQGLGETLARLRVTLSYFVEPNPGRKGYQQPNNYASCGLRFKAKSPTETIEDFRAQVNAEARNESSEDLGGRNYDNWVLGPRMRTKGSIHSDEWHGTAAELAEKETLAVYPVGGWWKFRSFLEKWENRIRYSLVVSIETEAEDVDIYNSIAVTQPISIS